MTTSTPISSAVLMREAARTSRRWQVYGARMGFSGALMALLLLGMWVSINVATDLMGGNATELSKLGRALFVIFTLLQTILALVMAPMMVSRAIIEERTDKTIELMVLSPIRVRHLLVSKILSQVLSILLIIIGSLPIMGMVLSLGGVGVDELVVITVGLVVTVVLMGSLGGFFAMFTESPLIATLASIFWAICLFLLLPLVHGLLSASPMVSAQVSPLFANAGNWWGLLVIFAYVPMIALTLELASRMFELRVSNADLRSYFSIKEWLGRPVLILFLSWLVSSIVVLPAIIGLSWWSALTFSGAPSLWEVAAQPVPAIGGAVGRILSLLWVMVLGTLMTWVYLRLGMDLVDVFDSMTGGTGRTRSRRRRSVGHKIWPNPVLWREARFSGWGGGSIGLFIMWILVMLLFFQSGVWIVPGGLLTLGILNACAAIALAMWMAAGSIEQERTRKTLVLLTMSGLRSWRILYGKTLAAAVPTLPFGLVAGIMIVLGHPHLALLEVGKAPIMDSVFRGVLACVWWIPVWWAMVHVAQWVGLRLKKRNSIYTMSLSLAGIALGLPTFVAWILKDLWFLSGPARVISAGLMPFAAPWEILVSMVLWVGVAVILQVLLIRNLRRWGGSIDG